MTDVVLGTIIGGAIGIAGSAVVAWIQARSFQQQQSRQIQHEKDGLLLSRRIAVRSKYLEPLSDHLSSLLASATDYEIKLVPILNLYYIDKKSEKIKLPEAHKQEFTRLLHEIEGELDQVHKGIPKVFKASGRVADAELTRRVTDLIHSEGVFEKSIRAMQHSLQGSTAGQDFEYDTAEIRKSTQDFQVQISYVQYRIESLLAGVDAGDE